MGMFRAPPFLSSETLVKLTDNHSMHSLRATCAGVATVKHVMHVYQSLFACKLVIVSAPYMKCVEMMLFSASK